MPDYKRSPELAGEDDDDLDKLPDDDEDEGKKAKARDDDELADDDDDEPGAAADDDDDEEDEGEIEKRARRVGWVPESEWRGDEDKWVPAREFLDRMTRNRSTYNRGIKTLVDTVERLEAKNEELTKRIDESGVVLRKINGRFEKAEENGYKRALRELEEKRLEAVENGDTTAFKDAEARIQNLKKREAEDDDDSGADGKDKTRAGGDDDAAKRKDEARRNPVMARWLEENPWFDEHVELAQAAQGIHVGLLKKNPGWSLERNLEEVAKQIRTRYPDFFQNDADDRRGRDTATGDRRRERDSRDRDRGDGRKGRRYSDLPPEAKKACDEFCRTIPDYTRADYLRTYEWDD